MPNQFSQKPALSDPLDYFVIGHLTADLTESGIRLGGTAAFSGLTSNALGLKTGILTSHRDDLDVSALKSLWMKKKESRTTTTFKNISDGVTREQYLFDRAETLMPKDVPDLPQSPSIIHLGPVANEIDPEILSIFPNSLKCMTPQGWFRSVNDQGQVELNGWQDAEKYLSQADIAVISIDDVRRDETYIASMASTIPVFVVTENYQGARIYWHNDARFINAPEVKYVDDTGAGDIFATAFFYRYFFTKDPWEAGRFAVLLASWSVTRSHLDSIPTADEIKKAKLEIMGY